MLINLKINWIKNKTEKVNITEIGLIFLMQLENSKKKRLKECLEQQSQMLLDAGVILASSSTNTGLLAREFICKGEEA